MTDRPILFSPPLVASIRAGRKTETRRIFTPDPGCVVTHAGGPPCPPRRWPFGADDGCHPPPQGHHHVHVRYDPDGPEFASNPRCPYGAPGGRLWVRTTWATAAEFDELAPSAVEEPGAPVWERSGAERNTEGRARGKWRPSIHMPRWASTLDLEVESIALERLQSITRAGILAEGVGHDTDTDARLLEKWSALWDSINARRGAPWSANPWVWVVKFRTN